ncbi:unnamed protein product [Euphydryas editha]|uniref:Uncharacterized protein n=1 Tax=Euphydryas editha TaxID=104508 RepID=A0AAU9UG74_EUPED|nr:unnamed protein product [Euphydryas editha]
MRAWAARHHLCPAGCGHACQAARTAATCATCAPGPRATTSAPPAAATPASSADRRVRARRAVRRVPPGRARPVRLVPGLRARRPPAPHARLGRAPPPLPRRLRPRLPVRLTDACARAELCAVCHQAVRGLFAWCQGCAHGGHLRHMRAWAARHHLCPAGCGHACQPCAACSPGARAARTAATCATCAPGPRATTSAPPAAATPASSADRRVRARRAVRRVPPGRARPVRLVPGLRARRPPAPHARLGRAPPPLPRRLRPRLPVRLTDACARAELCAVCHQAVRGLFAWCQGCAHGGHLRHMRAWAARHHLCPAGCGHACQFG